MLREGGFYARREVLDITDRDHGHVDIRFLDDGQPLTLDLIDMVLVEPEDQES
ncbi:MAG: hypothetical protein ACYCUM_08470 [Solirubrobacteraceae bacterium]